MDKNKKYIIPIIGGIIGVILGIISYTFYEPNIVIVVSLIILGILIGFRIVREK